MGCRSRHGRGDHARRPTQACILLFLLGLIGKQLEVATRYTKDFSKLPLGGDLLHVAFGAARLRGAGHAQSANSVISVKKYSTLQNDWVVDLR